MNAICFVNVPTPKGLRSRDGGLLHCEVPQRRLAIPDLINDYSRALTDSSVASRVNPPNASHSPRSDLFGQQYLP